MILRYLVRCNTDFIVIFWPVWTLAQLIVSLGGFVGQAASVWGGIRCYPTLWLPLNTWWTGFERRLWCMSSQSTGPTTSKTPSGPPMLASAWPGSSTMGLAPFPSRTMEEGPASYVRRTKSGLWSDHSKKQSKGQHLKSWPQCGPNDDDELDQGGPKHEVTSRLQRDVLDQVAWEEEV